MVWVPLTRDTFLLKREVPEKRALFYKLQYSHTWRYDVAENRML